MASTASVGTLRKALNYDSPAKRSALVSDLEFDSPSIARSLGASNAVLGKAAAVTVVKAPRPPSPAGSVASNGFATPNKGGRKGGAPAFVAVARRGAAARLADDDDDEEEEAAAQDGEDEPMKLDVLSPDKSARRKRSAGAGNKAGGKPAWLSPETGVAGLYLSAVAAASLLLPEIRAPLEKTTGTSTEWSDAEAQSSSLYFERAARIQGLAAALEVDLGRAVAKQAPAGWDFNARPPAANKPIRLAPVEVACTSNLAVFKRLLRPLATMRYAKASYAMQGPGQCLSAFGFWVTRQREPVLSVESFTALSASAQGSLRAEYEEMDEGSRKLCLEAAVAEFSAKRSSIREIRVSMPTQRHAALLDAPAAAAATAAGPAVARDSQRAAALASLQPSPAAAPVAAANQRAAGPRGAAAAPSRGKRAASAAAASAATASTASANLKTPGGEPSARGAGATAARLSRPGKKDLKEMAESDSPIKASPESKRRADAAAAEEAEAEEGDLDDGFQPKSKKQKRVAAAAAKKSGGAVKPVRVGRSASVSAAGPAAAAKPAVEEVEGEDGETRGAGVTPRARARADMQFRVLFPHLQLSRTLGSAATVSSASIIVADATLVTLEFERAATSSSFSSSSSSSSAAAAFGSSEESEGGSGSPDARLARDESVRGTLTLRIQYILRTVDAAQYARGEARVAAARIANAAEDKARRGAQAEALKEQQQLKAERAHTKASRALAKAAARGAAAAAKKPRGRKSSIGAVRAGRGRRTGAEGKKAPAAIKYDGDSEGEEAEAEAEDEEEEEEEEGEEASSSDDETVEQHGDDEEECGDAQLQDHAAAAADSDEEDGQEEEAEEEEAPILPSRRASRSAAKQAPVALAGKRRRE